MAKTAQELSDLILEAELKDQARGYELLRSRCIAATESMVRNREREVRVDLSEQETDGLEKVTDELRDLGYRFRFIERQNAKGEFSTYQLLISIQHCE